MPDWLVAEAWQTFGRMRTMHLTAVFYGWITNAALAAIVWLTPRLMRTTLRGAPWVVLGAVFLNIGVPAASGPLALAGRPGWSTWKFPGRSAFLSAWVWC